MYNILSGIDRLGFKDYSSITVYSNDELAKETPAYTGSGLESSAVLQREMTCPVCNGTFKSKAMKSRVSRLVSSDTDLKPNYANIEATAFEITMCIHCGFAGLTSLYTKLNENTAKKLKPYFLANYKPYNFKEYRTIEESILMYQQALFCCKLKSAKDSETGFTALKLAWLYRAIGDKFNEEKAMLTAYYVISNAYANETFPLAINIDEKVVDYVLGELARRTGNLDDAKRRIGRLLTSRDTPTKLKQRSEDVRELIKQDLREQEAKNA